MFTLGDKRKAVKEYLDSLDAPGNGAAPACPAVPADEDSDGPPELVNSSASEAEGKPTTRVRSRKLASAAQRALRLPPRIVVIAHEDLKGDPFTTQLLAGSMPDHPSVQMYKPKDPFMDKAISAVKVPGCLVVLNIHKDGPLPCSVTTKWKTVAKAASEVGGTVAIRIPSGGFMLDHKGIAAIIMAFDLVEVSSPSKRPYAVYTNNVHLQRGLAESKYVCEKREAIRFCLAQRERSAEQNLMFSFTQSGNVTAVPCAPCPVKTEVQAPRMPVTMRHEERRERVPEVQIPQNVAVARKV